MAFLMDNANITHKASTFYLNETFYYKLHFTGASLVVLFVYDLKETPICAEHQTVHAWVKFKPFV